VYQTQQLIPQLVVAVEVTGFRCEVLQRRFSPLKRAAAQMLASAREIRDGAYSKKEFVEGLLRICMEALMDQALEDDTRLVRDEVVNGYGGQLPSDVEKLAAELTEKINTFSSLPSLRQGITV